MAYGEQVPYTPPAWAQDLAVVPKSRMKLSMTPTPIHRWHLPGVPLAFEVSVKREDLAGSTLTGNKIRKLEFLLADAVSQGCDSVITIGGMNSNHARATVMAARQLGLQPHVMVLSPPEMKMGCRGNLLLTRLTGTKIVVFPIRTDITLEEQLVVIHEKTREYATRLSSQGHKAYIVPVGGSSTLGAWGYIDCFQEMMDQGLLDNYDDIVLAAGSVGTACGLAVAKHLTGASIKIHAVSIVHPEDFITEHIDQELDALGIRGVRAKDLIDPIMGYTGLGYGRSTEEELETIVKVMSKTGISLDSDFCVKGVRGMLGEMERDPDRFAGKRVLFIHSGGVFGLFDGRMEDTVGKTPITSQIFVRPQIVKSGEPEWPED